MKKVNVDTLSASEKSEFLDDAIELISDLRSLSESFLENDKLGLQVRNLLSRDAAKRLGKLSSSPT